MTCTQRYTITPARYAKKCVAVRTVSDGSGFKGHVDYIIGDLKARWSSRERAYIMSEAKGHKLDELVRAELSLREAPISNEDGKQCEARS